MATTNIWLEIFQKYAGTRRGDKGRMMMVSFGASPEHDVDDEDKSSVRTHLLHGTTSMEVPFIVW
jgi:hypothetical protein